jgi:hypothetical protein
LSEPEAWPLAPRAARVLYNVADAWLGPEAAACDRVAALAPLAPAARRRLERALFWLEWSPRLLLRSRRGLSWLPRAERRAWLERLERGGPFRRAVAIARGAVAGGAAGACDVARAAAGACDVAPGAPAGAQSREGA